MELDIAEINCLLFERKKTEFKLYYNSISENWQCRFDEISCSASGNGPCVSALLQCDGLDHCVNGADETNCPDNCENNEFHCSIQRKCISATWRCDGKVDCLGISYV